MQTIEKDSESMEKDLIELNEDIESFFTSHVVAQLFIDTDFQLRKFTSRAKKIFKLDESHIDKSLEEVIENIGHEELGDKIEQAIHNKEELEYEIETSNQKWFQLNISPYSESKQEEVKGVILTFIDITEKIEYLQELERLNEAHENFISSVSRNLREPLLQITLHIQELEENQKKLADSMLGSMKKINSAVNDVSKFILEITDLIRSEERSEDELQKTNIDEIIEEIKLILKTKINETGANISTELNATEIQFPRKKLRSILYTLICNAIRYRSPERTPEITLKTETANDHVHITVMDNGNGIEKDRQEEIFKKPKRYPSGNRDTGVGLHMVKEMVCSNGGKIEIISSPGKGTTFYLYLKKENGVRKNSMEIN